MKSDAPVVSHPPGNMIVPILKREKNPLGPTNYRPISLLRGLTKILEILATKEGTEGYCRRDQTKPTVRLITLQFNKQLYWTSKRNMVGSGARDFIIFSFHYGFLNWWHAG